MTNSIGFTNKTVCFFRRSSVSCRWWFFRHSPGRPHLNRQPIGCLFLSTNTLSLTESCTASWVCYQAHLVHAACLSPNLSSRESQYDSSMVHVYLFILWTLGQNPCGEMQNKREEVTFVEAITTRWPNTVSPVWNPHSAKVKGAMSSKTQRGEKKMANPVRFAWFY